ncbi:hypothetical protein N0V95_009454, partial [Ascochyta clinopodiicola]
MSSTTPTTHVKTRFLVISDTHASDPTQNVSNHDAPYRPPLPKADVLLHCGDLTMLGHLEEYEKTLTMLENVDAEVKLVIAGNHDITLDETYYARAGERMHRERWDKDLPRKAREMWLGERAKRAGVTYLEEGTYSFTLANGGLLRLIDHKDYAFPYFRTQDRYNPPHKCSPWVLPMAEHPVPDWSEIDVVMTHGPPMGILDTVYNGEHVGCENLIRAMRRCKPRMHCFGHIHEGWGAQKIQWAEGDELDVALQAHVMRATPIDVDQLQMKDERAAYVDISRGGDNAVEFGRDTLMVNASIMSVTYKPLQGPWLVDMDLEKAPIMSTLLWHEFLDDNKPEWFKDLPQNIQSYLVVQYGPSTAWPTASATSSAGSASSTASSSEPSAASATSSSTSSPDSQPASSSGLTEGQKIGIGIGVPLGFLALAAVLIPLCFACRKKKKKVSGYEPPPSPGFMPHGAFQEKSTSYQEYRRPLNNPTLSRSQSWDHDDELWMPEEPQHRAPNAMSDSPMGNSTTIVGPALVHTHSSNRARGKRTSYNSLHSVAEVREPDDEYVAYAPHKRMTRRPSMPLRPQDLPPIPASAGIHRKPIPQAESPVT